ncbi:hypothetical protein EG329_011176 [Mollisiaceae sp. DMI_Dod_QoI]|nr:hypothetical protein EG329_011176 [Helotiales sp. DMI_Dod_QoI]
MRSPKRRLLQLGEREKRTYAQPKEILKVELKRRSDEEGVRVYVESVDVLSDAKVSVTVAEDGIEVDGVTDEPVEVVSDDKVSDQVVEDDVSGALDESVAVYVDEKESDDADGIIDESVAVDIDATVSDEIVGEIAILVDRVVAVDGVPTRDTVLELGF